MVTYEMYLQYLERVTKLQARKDDINHQIEHIESFLQWKKDMYYLSQIDPNKLESPGHFKPFWGVMILFWLFILWRLI